VYAIEFSAKIRDGVIEVPEAYRHRLSDTVKVILVTEEQEIAVEDIIQTLLVRPLTLPGFAPLSRDEIYGGS